MLLLHARLFFRMLRQIRAFPCGSACAPSAGSSQRNYLDKARTETEEESVVVINSNNRGEGGG